VYSMQQSVLETCFCLALFSPFSKSSFRRRQSFPFVFLFFSLYPRKYERYRADFLCGCVISFFVLFFLGKLIRTEKTQGKQISIESMHTSTQPNLSPSSKEWIVVAALQCARAWGGGEVGGALHIWKHAQRGIACF
jgi:hypothetical protein